MEHTKELIERAHKGDKGARDRLVVENMGLVYSVVKRFAQRGYEFEDLCQIGTIGLIKAVDKFDVEYDVMFSTYAVPMIAGEIKRFLRDDGMIKVSRTLKENGYKLRKASEFISGKLGREVTIEELAAAAELSVEDAVMAIEANCDVESIYKTVYQGDGNEVYLIDKFSMENMAGATAQSNGAEEKVINKLLLKQLMESLNKEEQKVIMMRYFKEMTQSLVAEKLGISQVQVSRMEKKILEKLRKML